MTIGDENVARSYVAMNDTERVCVVDRFCNLSCDAHHFVERKAFGMMLQTITQRLAFHERHYVIENAARLARIVKRKDVRMGESRSDGDLAFEPVGADCCGERRREDLDGDLAVVPGVVANINRGHSATTELALDRVSSCQCRADQML